jgi:diadenosine tetraphosphate (Ap4A) HIT family hydrolase
MVNCIFCDLSLEDKKWLLYENEHWSVFLADKQDYIGRCIVVCNQHCASLTDLSLAQWDSLKFMINSLEAMFSKELNATMFNWSCLMNDSYKYDPPCPHVHFHFRPRYKEKIVIRDFSFKDHEFAHHYNNQAKVLINYETANQLFDLLKAKISIYFTE